MAACCEAWVTSSVALLDAGANVCCCLYVAKFSKTRMILPIGKAAQLHQ